MQREKLLKYLAQAERHVATGREQVARQRKLILQLHAKQLDTSFAEKLLSILLESLRLHEESRRRLARELDMSDGLGAERRTREVSGGPYPRNMSSNRLLNALSAGDLERLHPLLEPVRLRHRQRLQSPNRSINAVYFLDSGIAALETHNGGKHSQTQTAMIGREGMTGLPIVLGSDRSPHAVVMQIEGEAQCIPREDLIEVLEQSPSILGTFLRYTQAMLIQMAATAVVHAEATLEQKLARWLLMAADRSDTAEIDVTHDDMAVALSVRRAGVTVALQHLEAEGLIAKERGGVIIADRAGLIALAAGFYGAAEAEYDRLVGHAI